jgi:radical SAM superfamily enzyme YgiQ (UPF0313 family)
VRFVKELTNEVYVMGYHGTVEPAKILALAKAKAVIRGEPELTVLDICRGKELYSIEGLTLEHNGEILSTPDRAPLDLKNIPMPAFHLIDFKKYSYEILGNSFALFEISRGCKFNCIFCNKIMYGQRLRSKSRDQIYKEVSLAVEKYNVKTGYFIDLDFLSNREIVEGLCEYLINKKYGFRWTCQTRPDFLDAAILKLMRKAGCELIHFGIETGSQKLIDYLRKNIAIDKIKQNIKMCHSAGLKTLAFFIFGLPGETDAGRKEIFKFIKTLNTDLVSFHKLFPYKGSDIYAEKFNYETGVDKFIRRAFIKYYFRPKYLYRLKPFVIFNGIKLFFQRIMTLK